MSVSELWEVRRGTSGDVRMLRDLSLLTFCDAFEKDNNPDDFKTYIDQAFSEIQLIKELQDPDVRFFFVCENGKEIAYAKLGLENKEANMDNYRTIELERFYVLPERKGTRLASFLMDYCLKFSKDEGFQKIWLGVWEHNYRAQKFYSKQGFEVCGSHEFWVGKDCQTDLLMWKSIKNVE